MSRFQFKGEIPASKSILNRLLIVQSYFPDFRIFGDSNCSDIKDLKAALRSFKINAPAFCGDSATGFRFLAMRASRETGKHHITGSSRLLSRPHDALLALLEQLGVSASFNSQGLFIESQGWQLPASGILKVDRSVSSQFASAIVLNSWKLPKNLKLEFSGQKISESYLELSLELVRLLGMQIGLSSDGLQVPANQQVSVQDCRAELDLSSAFSIAAAGALAGESQITNFNFASKQPDGVFLSVLEQMGTSITFDQSHKSLLVSQPPLLRSGRWNLGNSPDLFPVLAVLCSFAEGKSVLYGAPHLAFKESNRIEKTAELLRLSGCSVEVRDDGLAITGNRDRQRLEFHFDPDSDHRLAMASGLLMLMGFSIQLTNSKVVDKSFPEFWQCLGMSHVF